MMLTDLAAACRKSGLDVVEGDGWRTRGHGDMGSVECIVAHHTATAASASGDYPSLRIVRDGRSDLPGPLSQLGLGRSGTVYVIAAGLSYHAGDVRDDWMGNYHAIGIEAEHPGVGPWPAAQYGAYARLCAALAEHYGVPIPRVLAHKEVCWPAGRKTDPNFDMRTFRAAVRRFKEEDMPLNDADKAWIVQQIDAGHERLLATIVDGKGDSAVTLKTALGRASRVPKKLDAVRRSLLDAVSSLVP